MPETIFNRFDPAKNYDDHRFVPGRGLQSAELNEIQSKAAFNLRSVAEALFKDGDIVRDAAIYVNTTNGEVQCQSGAIYLRGAVRGVPAATLNIPVIGVAQVGVRLVTDIITSLEDPDLLDPATGTRNFNSPGADRTRVTPSWAVGGVGTDGDFYPVYTVIDGIVQSKDIPPNLDGITQAIARYDRDSSGGTYVVRGMSVTALPDFDADTQVYSISEGRARVFGFPVEFFSSVRASLEAAPDLKPILNEPHLSTGTAPQRVLFDRTPGTAITEVSITAQKTVTLTHGAFTGAQDLLPDTSVLAIVSVVQGAVTYVTNTDYRLTAGRVDWSPGGSEPSPGSTYQVTYQYIATIQPTDVDDLGFTVSGAITGSLILVSYSQKLPRIDLLCLNTNGFPVFVEGVPAEFNPQAPRAPEDLLPIATIFQTWTAARLVKSDGVRLVPMPALAAVDGKFDFLLQLIAQQRLESSIHTREGGTKKGLFTDPFIDDTQRDAGTPQTGAVFGGILSLPIAAQIRYPDADISRPTTLAYNNTIVLSQDFRTGSQLINPFLAFAPAPAVFTLTPNIDRWTDVVTDSLSPITQRFTFGAGDQSSSVATTRTVLTGVTRGEAELLRPITISYNLNGFGPGEALQTLTFDGVNVLSGSPVANSEGIINGTFDIPSGIPSGSKSVIAGGSAGSRGTAIFSGQGTIERQTFQQQTTITETRWQSPPPPPEIPPRPSVINDNDPVAQTFTLEATSQISGVDLRFEARPTTTTIVQIRGVTVGFPNRTIFAEARLNPSAIQIGGGLTRFNFGFPVSLLAGQEYAIVIICNDAIGAVAIAELGKFDSDAQRWMTSQPYNVGVMLTSSNASTWTPHQDRDLTFRLLRANFTQNTRNVSLGSVTVSNATDLLLMGFTDRPNGRTGASFVLGLPGGSTLAVEDGQPVQLGAAVTGNIAVSVLLTGTANESPVLYRGTQIVAGTVAVTGSYVSRAVPAGPSSRVKVIYEAQVPSGASVASAYKGPDLGDAFVTMPVTATRQVDDGFVEYIHEVTGVNETSVQIRLLLAGNTAARPRVRDLRVMVL